MARLFIIPFLMINILDGRWTLAFALLMLAGLSDSLDGVLARWLHQKTTLGLYLDPIADKLLLSTLYLVLTHVHQIKPYVTILVFSRDLGIILLASLLFFTNTLRNFPPSLLGKLNTFIQICAVVGVLGSHVFPIPHLMDAAQWLLRIIAFLAPISAAEYAWIVIRRMSSQPAAPAAA